VVQSTAMKHLLIVSHDVVGRHMAGPGIRYWELARVLAPYAAVTLLAPRPINLAALGFATASYTWGDAASLATHLAHADMALVNGFVFEAHPELGESDLPLVVDLYDPTLLENLELLRTADPTARTDRYRRDVNLLSRQIAAGDFFLCATERQRDLYVGALMAAGRVTPDHVDTDPLLRDLIDVVPFGLPAEPPARSGPALRGMIGGIGPDDPIILWSGGLWDWMDPQSLIRAMPTVVAAVPNARLVFLAGTHPGAAAAMRTPEESRALADEFGLLGSSIFFYDSWVPYARRADFLLDASVVVSLHRQHLETAYAALRSRVLDHLWVGRASLVSAGDAAAELVARYDLGRVVPPQDVAAIAQMLCELLANSATLAACARRAQALAAEFTWERASVPIRRFCAAPRRTRLVARSLPQHEEPMSAGISHNQALQDLQRRLELSWKVGADLPSGGPVGLLRRLLLRLIAPHFAEQREFNAALVQRFYLERDQEQEQTTRMLALSAQALALAAQVGDIHQQIGDIHQQIGDIHRMIGDTHQMISHTHQMINDTHQRIDTVVQFDAEVNDRVARLTYTTGLLNDAAASADELLAGLASEVGQLKAVTEGESRDA
jgi:glycosyltransferase involved in cell wall biosynthesis